MNNQIVVVNVSQTIAPTPNKLQKTGALVSQGGTTTAIGTQTLLRSAADLTAILTPAAAITSMSWTTGVVTVIAAAPHGFSNGATLWMVIAGATPSTYNGLHLCTITTNSHFTFPLVSDPGAETIPGTYQLASASELLQMVTTFFAQGTGQAVWVNELGVGSPAAGVTALNTWIQNNPGSYYSYLVPREWAGESTYLTFLAQFEATNAKVYFFTTMTLSNYTTFTALMKCVFGMVEAPGTPSTEFSLAAAFRVTLNYNPSSTNKVPPTSFAFLFGVTPYPLSGNQTILAALQASGVNYVGTGGEGGISNTVLFWGTTMDVRPFNYWYSVDWVQINIQLDVANAVINGSNNPSNPLYYNQDGINRLQGVGRRTLTNGVSFGLVFGTVAQSSLSQDDFNAAFDDGDFDGEAIINAVPLTVYASQNPSDYKDGIYQGFAISYSPARGFVNIVFFVNVTDFLVAA
jgi:hypothetical protein